MEKKELVIVGGGPAGMSAAVAAYDCGIRDILIIEREEALGGILKQCIHNGFGLHRFGEELTGPEYSYRYEKMVYERSIPFITETTVLDITPDKIITASNSQKGVFKIEAKAIILAMGCRERPAGALRIPGDRPAGVFSAGTAQKYVNLMGYMPGKEVVILGSGDIGLIMARRMTLEGAKVHAVCELMPYSGGLIRNIEQCLNDFGIPLKLSHTVTKLHGKKRLTGVTIAKVDEKLRPIPETEEFIKCDTLLLSVGLIPENELTKGADISLDRRTNGAYVDQNRSCGDGIFACGNVLHVHDLVDYVSEEAEIAGRAASEYIKNASCIKADITLNTGFGVRYTVPQRITEKKDVSVYFRVSDVYKNATVKVCDDKGNTVLSKKKIKLAPGEMECVNLKKDMLEQVSALTVSLEVAR